LPHLKINTKIVKYISRKGGIKSEDGKTKNGEGRMENGEKTFPLLHFRGKNNLLSLEGR